MSTHHNYYVYLMTNWDGRVMYAGMTNDLERRVSEHRVKLVPGFTRKYNITKLVHYEHFHDVSAAITREKEIKGWRREKKDALVRDNNPGWEDLFEKIKWGTAPDIRA